MKNVSRLALASLLALATATICSTSAADLATGKFVNPIGEGADPWVVRDPNANRYLWCMSEGNRAIAIGVSDNLASLGEKHIVWSAPETGPYSQELWAPELHFLDGHWHVYVAADDGKNANHLAYVLRSKTSDPLSEYEIHGPLATGDGADGRSPNVWAIDMTVLEVGGKRYALWSGWDAPGTDQQYLYIAPMKSPTELAGPRVLLCHNADYLWERTEEKLDSRGLNEGPQILQHAGRTFVTYSCAASWLPTYKLGMLELVGRDPLDPKAWKKFAEPVFQATEQTYGVGHSCFAQSPDGSQWWHIFHAKRDRNPGWRRAVFVQPFTFDADGTPQFGEPVAPGTVLDLPSGTKTSQVTLPYSSPLSDLTGMTYLGHHQFYQTSKQGVELGRVPGKPINAYRSGEKLLIDNAHWGDFSAEVTIRFLRGDRDAGLLFRASGASVGYDAQHGYFAGLIPGSKAVVVGKMDGSGWQELALRKVNFDPRRPNVLKVTAVGDQITVAVNGNPVVELKDATYAAGSVGPRVVNTHARFENLKVTKP